MAFTPDPQDPGPHPDCFLFTATVLQIIKLMAGVNQWDRNAVASNVLRTGKFVNHPLTMVSVRATGEATW